MAQKISVKIGRDESGKGFHLPLTKGGVLIGGTTGSGKSTMLHRLLVSLINRFDDYELRIFIGDPKRIEFVRYTDSPQVARVARDVTEHERMIKHLVTLMEARFTLLEQCKDEHGIAVHGVFHNTIQGTINGVLRKFCFPNIIVIIDELEFLTLNKQSRPIIENLVKLAQLGRAAGITLIVATQYPTSKVVDARIKANCTSRICMRVASAVNSRVILDAVGAERLDGYDCFVKSPCINNMVRVHGDRIEFDVIEAHIAASVYHKQNRKTSKDDMEFLENEGKRECFDFQSPKLYQGFSARNDSGLRFINPN